MILFISHFTYNIFINIMYVRVLILNFNPRGLDHNNVIISYILFYFFYNFWTCNRWAVYNYFRSSNKVIILFLNIIHIKNIENHSIFI